MFRLMKIQLFTPDVVRLQTFYERLVGLRASASSPNWTAYSTRGALLALGPTRAASPYVELTFETDDLDSAARSLRDRGADIAGEIAVDGWGRMLPLQDSEGNALVLAQPHDPVKKGDRGALSLGTAVVGARDVAGAKAFYQHVMALRMVHDAPSWVQFDTGDTRLAILPRKDGAGRAGPISFGFSIPNLMDWAEGARQRGLRFSIAPRDEDWGLFSNALDPDGNEVRFFEPSAPPGLEEELAEAFEDDSAPHQVAIRKPVKKASKAASRVAIRPDYKGNSAPKRRRPSATTMRVASVRGAGEARTRLKPKRTADEKKAKVKPATRRQLKAKLAVLETKKTDVAQSSKARPVKRDSKPARRTERRALRSAGRKR